MIQQKQKKCKGTGKATGHGCGEVSYLMRYGLCKTCFRDWLYNTPEGKETLSKTLKTARNKIIKEQRKQSRNEKEENKSIAQLIQEARKPFQQYIRMRDADEKCICCDNNSETWDAGHFYKAEIYSGIIFDEINVNKQRVYCNQYLHGNEGNYRIGLIKKYGEKIVSDLDKRAIETKNYKWSRQELIDIKKHYQEKLKA